MTKVNDILTRLLNSRALRWLLRVTVFFLITYISILSAIVSYSSFRWYIVPSRGWSIPVNLQYGLGRVPFDTVTIPTHKVSADQTYDIALEMHLPNSINNLKLGNFMITLQLENTFTSELVTSKPALLTWQHPSVITSLLYKNTQTMKVPLSTQILKPSTRSLRQMTITGATVTVGREDWLGANNTLPHKELHVYDAALLFSIRLAGVSWLLVTFPITSFFVFTALAFVSIWSAAMLVWCGTREQGQLDDGETSESGRLHDTSDRDHLDDESQRSIDSSRQETPSESVTLSGESVTSSQWRAYDDSGSENAETAEETADTPETPTASTPELLLTPLGDDQATQLRHRTARDYQASDSDNTE
ncbi:hypothetical protein E3P99_02708 [Wallemia hederae]|uniref:Seipin n=1 Tax=Wallemia hederae TaxID=1540922 RepID=A0A4T0FJ08_9BASI|nr:hypothetical protein E3P99_02708 [Wallemia hederae]